MIRTLVLLWGLVAPVIAQAAIGIDATSSAESGVPGTSTSHAHLIGATSGLALICVSSRDTSAAIQPVTSVTVGGQAASLIARVQNSANALSAELWGKTSPLTGSQTIAVTNDAANERTVTTVVSLTGVYWLSPYGTPVTASDPGSADANVNVDTIGSAAGELGILCGAARVNTTTVAPDATAPASNEVVERAHADSTSLIGFLYSEGGASSTIDMRADLTPAERWAAVGVSIKPASTSGAWLYKRREQ